MMRIIVSRSKMSGFLYNNKIACNKSIPFDLRFVNLNYHYSPLLVAGYFFYHGINIKANDENQLPHHALKRHKTTQLMKVPISTWQSGAGITLV